MVLETLREHSKAHGKGAMESHIHCRTIHSKGRHRFQRQHRLLCSTDVEEARPSAVRQNHESLEDTWKKPVSR